MPSGSILLADDEEKILKTLGRALREEGHDVVTTAHALEAQRLLVERPFDLLVIDYLMPERTGLEVIRELVGTTPEGERPAIVMMTAHGTVESAVEAMKLGARDYLQKPFEVDELLVTVRRLLEDQRTRTGLRYLLSERDAEFNHYGLVGRSRPILDVIKRAELVAESRSTVLVSGETGTGKELVARAHSRAQRPAGHAAHQGELRRDPGNAARIRALRPRARRVYRRELHQERPLRPGRRRHDLPRRNRRPSVPAVQAKLLRVLQDREFEPLGAERTQRVDVRVIAATNRDLRQMVSTGQISGGLCTTA